MVKTETPSDAPVELAKNGIRIRIKWQYIVPALIVLLGSGTVAGAVSMFTTGGATAPALEAFKFEQNTQHTKINATLDKQDARAQSQDIRIEKISEVVSSVQTTQQRDVARTEARRLTEKINNRLERENTYDRIYELNLSRLKRGSDPCGSIACE